MENWQNYVARILSLLVTGTILSACYAPGVTLTQTEVDLEPVTSEVIETEVPTFESTVTDTPTATKTSPPTSTPGPSPIEVDMETLKLMASEWPSTDLYSVEQITFGDLLSIASKVYSGAGGSEATVEDGLLSHLTHQGIFAGDKYPEMDEIIQGPVEVYISTKLDLTGFAERISPPKPTVTPTPLPYSHKAFDVEIIGVNEHGAMLELIYNGDIGDLTELTIKAELLQNRKFKEEQVFNTLDNKLLAELTDAIYDLGELTVKLQFPQDLESLGASEIELKIDYGRLFPWMHYIYGDSRLAYRFSYPWDPDHLEAWDLQPISDDFPDGDGHPVTPPCEGTVVRSEVIPGSKGTNNMVIYCEDTGYYVQLGHMDRQVFIGDHVTTDTIAGYLHWEEIISRPHNHTKLRRLKIIKTDHSSSTEANDYVDMFNPHVQLGGEALPFGFWLEDTLPEEVKILIEKGVFQWPEYLLPKE